MYLIDIDMQIVRLYADRVPTEVAPCKNCLPKSAPWFIAAASAPSSHSAVASGFAFIRHRSVMLRSRNPATDILML